MKRGLDDTTLACLPKTRDDSVSRGTTRKAVKSN